MRDITLGDTFYHFFTTRAFATGVPATLSGTPVLSVLEENNVTPITAGVSVQVDRASVVGLNQATIVATGANGFETGKSYGIYISTGTSGGTSVIGEVVGEFTIEKSAAFIRLGAPAGASVSADIAAIEAQTDDIGVAGAGLTALGDTRIANLDATVSSRLAPTVAARTLDVSAGGEAGVDWANVGTQSTAVNLSATTVNLTNTVTTYTGNTVQTGDSFARLGLPAGASVSADIAAIEAQTDDIGAAGAGLTAIWTTALTQSYATDGSTFTGAQALYMMWAFMAEKAIVGTTLTANQLDGTTAAMTFTLSDPTNPVSVTRAT